MYYHRKADALNDSAVQGNAAAINAVDSLPETNIIIEIGRTARMAGDYVDVIQDVTVAAWADGGVHTTKQITAAAPNWYYSCGDVLIGGDVVGDDSETAYVAVWGQYLRVSDGTVVNSLSEV